ncbi:MAG: DUF2500 domain-containing protein [Eubacterium sp.]|nr:DUF2500 domain-containing protein [Eubacterium sp.]
MNFGYRGYIIFEYMFTIAFILILGVIVIMVVKNIATWNKNNNSPRLTVEAKVMSKRTAITHHHDSMSSTRYYVTFQVDSGDRMELPMTGSEYGMLAEGDVGKLTFQGTRYLSFERK